MRARALVSGPRIEPRGPGGGVRPTAVEDDVVGSTAAHSGGSVGVEKMVNGASVLGCQVMECEIDLQQIVEAQLSLSTQLIEAHAQIISLARQVKILSTKKDCRRRLGLCLICRAAEHQMVNCSRWIPRSKEKKTGFP